MENKSINILCFEALNTSIYSGITGNKNSLDKTVKKSVGIIKKIIFLIFIVCPFICLIVPKKEIKKTRSNEYVVAS